MSRVSFFMVALVLLLSMARAEEEGLVRVPGAFAELGWQGRFSRGSWVEFRLVATGAGAFTAELTTTEGKVLEGLTPITAQLELPDGVGIRETRLLLPITTTRMVKISLSGATGSDFKRFEPSSSAIELDGSRLPLDSSLYLSGHRITNQLEPKTALVVLAGGAQIREIPKGLERGNWGLGAIGGSSEPPQFLRILTQFAPQVTAPPRRHALLGFWAVGIFVVLLGLYSLKRRDPKYTIALAGSSLMLAGVGWWASQPTAPYTEKTKQILIGARGWGTLWTVHSRFSLRPEWVLPAGALPLEPEIHIERKYNSTQTTLKKAGWQQVRYLTPPKASRIPIRLEENRLINDSNTPLERIFVRGYGRQEPLQAGQSREMTAQIYETLPWDEYTELMQTLPDGAVMAQQPNGRLLIALADGK